jgi:hypothetical protein
MIGRLLHPKCGSVLHKTAYGRRNNFHENNVVSVRYWSWFEVYFTLLSVASNNCISPLSWFMIITPLIQFFLYIHLLSMSSGAVIIIGPTNTLRSMQWF